VLTQGSSVLYMEIKWMAAGKPGTQLMAKVTTPYILFSKITTFLKVSIRGDGQTVTWI
jgi:hypothetical protein